MNQTQRTMKGGKKCIVKDCESASGDGIRFFRLDTEKGQKIYQELLKNKIPLRSHAKSSRICEKELEISDSVRRIRKRQTVAVKSSFMNLPKQRRTTRKPPTPRSPLPAVVHHEVVDPITEFEEQSTENDHDVLTELETISPPSSSSNRPFIPRMSPRLIRSQNEVSKLVQMTETSRQTIERLESIVCELRKELDDTIANLSQAQSTISRLEEKKSRHKSRRDCLENQVRDLAEELEVVTTELSIRVSSDPSKVLHLHANFSKPEHCSEWTGIRHLSNLFVLVLPSLLQYIPSRQRTELAKLEGGIQGVFNSFMVRMWKGLQLKNFKHLGKPEVVSRRFRVILHALAQWARTYISFPTAEQWVADTNNLDILNTNPSKLFFFVDGSYTQVYEPNLDPKYVLFVNVILNFEF